MSGPTTLDRVPRRLPVRGPVGRGDPHTEDPGGMYFGGERGRTQSRLRPGPPSLFSCFPTVEFHQGSLPNEKEICGKGDLRGRTRPLCVVYLPLTKVNSDRKAIGKKYVSCRTSREPPRDRIGQKREAIGGVGGEGETRGRSGGGGLRTDRETSSKRPSVTTTGPGSLDMAEHQCPTRRRTVDTEDPNRQETQNPELQVVEDLFLPYPGRRSRLRSPPVKDLGLFDTSSYPPVFPVEALSPTTERVSRSHDRPFPSARVYIQDGVELDS